MQKVSSFVSSLILIGGIVLVLAITVGVVFYQVRVDAVTASLQNDQAIHILFVLHEDEQPISTQVVFLHPSAHRAGLLDIPADLGDIISRLERVDAVSSLFPLGGVSAYQKKIASIIGTDIDYYIVLSRQQMQEVVDLLGGITVFIPDPVSDPENMLFLPGGKITLDGEKLQSFFTYETEILTEVELISSYQEVIMQLLWNLGSHADLYKHYPRLFESRMDTNLDRSNMQSFLGFLAELSPERMIQQRVLGTVRSIEINGEQRQLLFPYFEGQLLKDTVRQVQETLAAGSSLEGDGSPIRIELLNGTRRNGLAHRTSELLEGYGFEVVRIGNAPTMNVASTQVFNHLETEQRAQVVADFIGVNTVKDIASLQELLLAEVDGEDEQNLDLLEPEGDNESLEAVGVDDSPVDVTVILGSDFDEWKVQ